ncbi:hypothetical protein B0H19DRAFT_1272797 [Mycena capillaripes]|nr:hypothetical protein B0H19DRAFT_1272797 [Mycena capillaripes]
MLFFWSEIFVASLSDARPTRGHVLHAPSLPTLPERIDTIGIRAIAEHNGLGAVKRHQIRLRGSRPAAGRRIDETDAGVPLRDVACGGSHFPPTAERSVQLVGICSLASGAAPRTPATFVRIGVPGQTMALDIAHLFNYQWKRT